MTREEKKAIDGNKYYPEDVNGYYAFLHGAEWSDKHPKNVWHDASEEPEDNSHILIRYKYLGTMEFKSYHVNYQCDFTWSELVDFQEIGCWAYVDDIFSKGCKK